MLLASADVKVLPKGIVYALLQLISHYSRRSCCFLCCAYVLQARLSNGLSSLPGVAAVDLFFVVDTPLLSLLFDGCFIVIATRVDTLPLTSLWVPPHAGS